MIRFFSEIMFKKENDKVNFTVINFDILPSTNEYIEKMIDFIHTSKRGVLLKTHKTGHQSLSDEE